MGEFESITQHAVDGLHAARDIVDRFVAYLRDIKAGEPLTEFEAGLKPLLDALEMHRTQARNGLTDPVVAMLVNGRAHAQNFEKLLVFDKECPTHHSAACVLLSRFTECFVVDEFGTLPVWVNAILFPDIREHYAYPDGDPYYYRVVWERMRAFPMQQADNLRAAVVTEAAAARAMLSRDTVPMEAYKAVRHEIDDPIEPMEAARMVERAKVGLGFAKARTQLSTMAASGNLPHNGKTGTRAVRYSKRAIEAFILQRKEDRTNANDRVKEERKTDCIQEQLDVPLVDMNRAILDSVDKRRMQKVARKRKSNVTR